MKSPLFEVRLNTGTGILLPEKIIFPFLKKKQKRVRVEAHFEGKTIHLHAAIQRRGEIHYMMFGKSNQKALGIFPNDYFQLQFFEDDSKYGVEISEELEAVLYSDQEAFQIFESFTAGKKRGIIYMISRYKVSQTRIDKSILLCENLKRGIRDNMELLKAF